MKHKTHALFFFLWAVMVALSLYSFDKWHNPTDAVEAILFGMMACANYVVGYLKK